MRVSAYCDITASVQDSKEEWQRQAVNDCANADVEVLWSTLAGVLSASERLSQQPHVREGTLAQQTHCTISSTATLLSRANQDE